MTSELENLQRLDAHKLLTVAQQITDDEHGRLYLADGCKAFVQTIEIDGFNYNLYVALEHIGVSVTETGETTNDN